MADPSPEATPAGGQEPQGAEGQVPDDADVTSTPDDGQEPKGRTYSEAYVRALRRETAGYRTRLADVEERLQAVDDKERSEVEKLGAKLADSESRATAAEGRLIRYEVAAERGLEGTAVNFLVGTTREEIEASADELVQLLADKGQRAPASFDGGARQPAPESKSPEEAHNDFLLRALGRKP